MHSASQPSEKQKPATKLDLNRIDGVYSYVFSSSVNIDNLYSSLVSYYGMEEPSNEFQVFIEDRCKSIEVLKHINLTLYHLTRGFAYEYFSSIIKQTSSEAAAWMEKAFEAYSLALTAYFDNIEEVHDLQRSYQKLVQEANGTYKKELYDFIFRLYRLDHNNFPSSAELTDALKKLQQNIDYLEDPYQEIGIALLARTSEIPSNKLNDLEQLATLNSFVSDLHLAFIREGYDQDLWLIEKHFSKIALANQAPQESNERHHWLLHHLFMTRNIPAFIKELSKAHMQDHSEIKHTLESKQEQQEADSTPMETSSIGPEQFRRKILRAKKSADGQEKTKIVSHPTSQNLPAHDLDLDSDSDDEVKIMCLR